MVDQTRINRLTTQLANQIAAGEVVERPASIVKELIENSIDAGANRVDIDLEKGGQELIRVLDNGHGIHSEDLPLALTRHATSKIRKPDELLEIRTLGFRGEALASICSVARISIRSRQKNSRSGYELRSIPGEAFTSSPVGMPLGTRVEVRNLFATVPARRKFLRAEATEVGHCSEAVLRSALVHPQVQFRLCHGRRVLLHLHAGSLEQRVQQLLGRRGEGPFLAISGEQDGVKVQAWLAPGKSALRQRNGLFIAVRRRVVSERSLARIVQHCYDDGLPSKHYPLACLLVDPPHGTVDVNVHPQKSEVRFSDAQQVYASVRTVLESARGRLAGWEGVQEANLSGGEESFDEQDGVSKTKTMAALEAWAGRDRERPTQAHDGESIQYSPEAHGRGNRLSSSSWGEMDPPRKREGGYRLNTRAQSSSYTDYKHTIRQEVDVLKRRIEVEKTERQLDYFPPAERSWEGKNEGEEEKRLPSSDRLRQNIGGKEEASLMDKSEEVSLLTILAGPTAIYEWKGQLLVADLKRVRSYLLYRRLLREVGDGKNLHSQVLLQPMVLSRNAEDVQLCVEQGQRLAELAFTVEGFGETTLLLRALPASLADALDEQKASKLLDKIIPWLRLKDHVGGGEERTRVLKSLCEGKTHESARENNPAPRLAKLWMRELLAEIGAEALHGVPGVRHWSVLELLGSA